MRSAAIVVALIAAPALAVVTGTTGSAAVAPIPASLTLGAFESDTQTRVMFERNRNLPEGQEVDITQPGLVDQTTDLTPGLIPAGTAVRSYILHADSVGIANRVYEGSVTFSEEILGIMTSSNRLANTDPRFGAEGTVYWINTSRGLDLTATTGNDSLLLALDRHMLSFRFVVGEAMDEVRVLTTVPSPAGAAVFPLTLLAGLRRRR